MSLLSGPMWASLRGSFEARNGFPGRTEELDWLTWQVESVEESFIADELGLDPDEHPSYCIMIIYLKLERNNHRLIPHKT